jgi:hypothetical protein
MAVKQIMLYCQIGSRGNVDEHSSLLRCYSVLIGKHNLKMEATHTLKTSVTIYQSIQHNISEYLNLHCYNDYDIMYFTNIQWENPKGSTFIMPESAISYLVKVLQTPEIMMH